MTSLNVFKGSMTRKVKEEQMTKNDKLQADISNNAKRTAENSPELCPKKRSVFGDITNAFVAEPKKAFEQVVKKASTRLSKKQNKSDSQNQKKTQQAEQDQCDSQKQVDSYCSKDTLSSQEQGEDTTHITVAKEEGDETKEPKPASEATTFISDTLPPGVLDFDNESLQDPFAEPNYVNDIFNYYKKRELKFVTDKYLSRQPELSKSMRAILVDWMVEVQESFELNHETLYLAVKLVDHYLMKNPVPKSTLQLVGSTAIFIACKFDERIPPVIDEFLYICDDAYSRKELLKMEISILKAMNFDLGLSLSYRFLRRYARCAKVTMEVLTLARYILETSLMDYDLIDTRDSMVAAAALYLAIQMKNLGEWSPTLEYHSGYNASDLENLVLRLNKLITTPLHKNLQTVRTKYSHKVFFEVAKIPPLQT
ncbi:G2/mitotic-specific cyclin-B3-like [Limulus polyphemus]|uniref:G2/mitotic-specific cyclin-B3-like n=1 Tax=Limulus polyphemus TaxID=6850 RepID=A0ABM1BDL7_LIMPO|nr:G2/mitotic-specific cyclin-B3-like [Limulus polyphemus]XP_022247973.1 G2/mitotic-specific cyclin-B3-like [Limulus polyphemus]XP_022247977.1 G2/mitotic-specific cyclin-B3-like [Limulus polyphemus]XP_022247981.1 G2/mitotic-specific cyclin-B3-like [Limulus polyphemus]